MLYPSINEIKTKVDSRYTLVILAAKRARDIVDGKPALVATDIKRPVSIAAQEINEDMVKCKYYDEAEAEKEAEQAALEEAAEEAEAAASSDEGVLTADSLADAEKEVDEEAREEVKEEAPEEEELEAVTLEEDE